jgi:hypothetical protein
MTTMGYGGRVSNFIIKKPPPQTRKCTVNSAFVEEREDTDASPPLITVQTFKQVCVRVCVL